MSRKCSSCLSLGSPVAVNRGLSPSQRGEYMVSREALVRCGEKCVNKNHLRLTLRSGHSRQGMTTEGFFVVVVVVAIRSTLRSGHTRQGMTTDGFLLLLSSLTFSLPTMIINAFWCSFLPKHRNLKQNEVQSAGVDSSLC